MAIKDDGTDGEAYLLERELTVVGRTSGHLVFEDDTFLADRHAELIYQADKLSIRPLESTNGVFVRITEDEEIQSGDYLRVGQELLRFDLLDELVREPSTTGGLALLSSRAAPEAWARLVQVVQEGTFADSYILDMDDVYLGRDRGHIKFPEDGFVSGSHAVIARRRGRVFLRDLNSSNGTYLRLRSSRSLVEGDVVLVGQQLFRIEPT